MAVDDWLELSLSLSSQSSADAPQQNSTQQGIEIPLEERPPLDNVHGSTSAATQQNFTQHGVEIPLEERSSLEDVHGSTSAAPQQNSTQQGVEIPLEQSPRSSLDSMQGSIQHGITPQLQPTFTFMPPHQRPWGSFFFSPFAIPRPPPIHAPPPLPLPMYASPPLPLPPHAPSPPPVPTHALSPFPPQPPRERPQRIRQRRTHGRPLGNDRSETINPPYPWATNRRATVHNMEWLKSKGIHKITGSVKCTNCERQFEIEYDLEEKFRKIAQFIYRIRQLMHQRAPKKWAEPKKFPDCPYCNKEKCAKPILGKKRGINWLFLLLGQMLGYCTLNELRYFCKHTRNHKTGAKNRVLFLTYMGICKQLDPNGPYNVFV